MAFRELIDRSDSLFGREPDLTHLLQRSEHRGLTAIEGRAQMGKSSLLMELARRLWTDSTPSLLAPQPRLIGFVESEGETSDLMLRAVVDLYSRWLSNSNYREQAKVVFAQQRHDFIGRAGEAVGTLFEKLFKLAGGPLEVVGGLVKETFEGLAVVNRELQSGGIQLPRLQIEQGRDLLDIVHKITKRHIVLIFDQWEKSRDATLEGNILDSFLRHVEDWPASHIFLSLRPEGVPHAVIWEFQRAYPSFVEVYDLPPMHLDAHSASAMLRFVRDRTPAAKDVSDEELLNIIAGYPATVTRWTNPEISLPKDSVADLRQIANDANNYRFREFDKVLQDLPEVENRLAMRVALMPGCKETDVWDALKTILLEEAKPRNLDVLKKIGVFESIAPPTYGHDKRREAALHWFKNNSLGELGEICESLIYNLASRIRNLTPQEVPFLESLKDISIAAFGLGVATGPMALCQSCLALNGVYFVGPKAVLGFGVKLQPLPSSVAPLLAIGQFSALNHALEDQDFLRRDALLLELRDMARTYPEENRVLEFLAKGLYNTLNHAKHDGNLPLRDALLVELRELVKSRYQNVEVRSTFAMALSNTLMCAREEGVPRRRGDLLVELRDLARSHPEEVDVHESLARALFNALKFPEEKEDHQSRDALLGELRKLVNFDTKDAFVRGTLADGLMIALIDAQEGNDCQRGEMLLNELRDLAGSHPEDATVNESLAKSLYNMLDYYANGQENAPQRSALLVELRELAKSRFQDVEVGKMLAMALSNALADAKEDKDLQKCDTLLVELRQLARSHPEEVLVRETLALGLYNMLADPGTEEDLQRRHALLSELRELLQSLPEDQISTELASRVDSL